MRLFLPRPVEQVLLRLNRKGYEAYAVGGCVRDQLLGAIPKDWDVATSALPQETMRVFSGFRVIETGIQHGTVTVISEGIPVEITTYRVDGTYSDHRHPDHIQFTHSLREDLSRRDFTINAMAYSEQTGVIDCFGGLEDLQDGIIRCVGSPKLRFSEDALRILRALRFSSVLGFAMDSETHREILQQFPLLKKIAPERIFSELCKLICGSNAEAVLLEYRDVFAEFLPELRPMFGFDQRNPHHIYDVWTHSVKAMCAVEPTVLLRLVMLLHDIGKPSVFTLDDQGTGHFYGHGKRSVAIAETVLKRLRCDKETLQTALLLIRYHDMPLQNDKKWLKRRLNELGKENFYRLMKVKEADARAQSPDSLKRLEFYREVESSIGNIIEEGQCFSLRDLAVSGNDLIAIGVKRGPEIGRLLQRLLEAVIDGALENDRTVLLQAAQEWRDADGTD